MLPSVLNKELLMQNFVSMMVAVSHTLRLRQAVGFYELFIALLNKWNTVAQSCGFSLDVKETIGMILCDGIPVGEVWPFTIRPSWIAEACRIWCRLGLLV
jgi:hypothetical protein